MSKSRYRISTRYRDCITITKRMEQVDLIKRERSEVDQREVFIHLTDKSETIRPELSTASEKVATASSLSKEVKRT